ncbi:MAG: UDP-N-acetylmuramate dehydrogenase [Gammaproteobacteria bacterium AqS3]|nr:UDP-N-acetylmuramate dehydrogenase [Gammaproteobacteria bacterium AqS3]
MELDIARDAELSDCNTMRVQARTGALVRIHSTEQLRALSERWVGDFDPGTVRLLGQGSNSIPCDWPGAVVQLRLGGIEVLDEGERLVRVRIGAGEDWPSLVRTALERGWYGLENLAMIPGSVGAAPVQNIGAYGVELSDRLAAVEVFDWSDRTRRLIPADELQLGYRTSRLRGAQGVWVLAIHLDLLRCPDVVTDYPSLLEELERRSGGGSAARPTPEAVFEAVCALRGRKLPDWRRHPNAGSFFHNPEVDRAEAERLAAAFPDLPRWPVPEGWRVPAGWLLERCGWRGRRSGPLEFWRDHALTLVNHGGAASSSEIIEFARQAMDAVQKTFGLALTVEPMLWEAERLNLKRPQTQ